MKLVVRYSLSALLLLASAASFSAFEYFKLFTTADAYVVYGALAVVLFTAGMYILFSQKKERRKANFWNAGLLGLSGVILYVAYLQVRASETLPTLTGSGKRCESLLLPLFRYQMEYEGTSANRNVCTLGFVKNQMSILSEASAEEVLFKLPAIFEAQDRFDETTLIILLSFWNGLQEKWHQKEFMGENPEFVRIKRTLDVYDGDLVLLETYQLKPIWSYASQSNAEKLRIQKALEISTLGKLLNTLIPQIEKNFARLEALEKGPPLPSPGPGQLTLLNIREKKLNERLNRLVLKWNLKAHLDSLNLQDTFPDAYQEMARNAEINLPLLLKSN